MKSLGGASLLGLALLFFGCKTVPPKPPLVETVAILLFDNEANNINASDIMEDLVYRALISSPYRLLDPSIVKNKLNTAGIVDGGQLPTVDPVKLGKDLGVQALMYGNVTHFNYVNIGFYFQRKVGLELKLVDVNNGQTLWENTGVMSNTKMTLDLKEVGGNFGEGIAQQALDKLSKTPLQQEAMLATQKALRTLPGFRFTGFAAPPPPTKEQEKASNEFDKLSK